MPYFYYENIGFAITTTTAAELCLLNVRGIKHLGWVIENESATKRLDMTWTTYAELDSSPDVKSLIKTEADVAVATSSTVKRFINVGSHTRGVDPDAAPAVVDALPASWFQLKVDAEDATSVTGNLWVNGLYQ